MELLLVRHGETVADVEGRHEGHADFPLTDRGSRQAELLAEWIARHYPPDLVLSSTLQRAKDTAHIIGVALGLTVMFDDDLVEIGNGVYAGLTYEEADRLYPWPEDGFKPHEAPPQGESRIAFRCRIETFWSRFRHTVGDEHRRVAIVTHGGVISMLYRCFLRLSIDADVGVRTDDTGIHLWRLAGETKVILFANRLDHLDRRTRENPSGSQCLVHRAFSPSGRAASGRRRPPL